MNFVETKYVSSPFNLQYLEENGFIVRNAAELIILRNEVEELRRSLYNKLPPQLEYALISDKAPPIIVIYVYSYYGNNIKEAIFKFEDIKKLNGVIFKQDFDDLVDK